jgi:hypothetical protein
MVRRRALGALLATAVLAACGSTVQQTGGTALGSVPAADELGVAPGADGLAPTAGDGPAAAGGAGPAAVGGARAGQTGRAATATGSATRAQLTTGPIKVGFLHTKVGNAAAFGLNVGESFTPRDVFEAAVKAINAGGGLVGRPLVPVVAETDTASASWEADYQAACETFTRDNKVAAVLGYSFVMLDSFEGCLAKAAIPHLNGGYNLGDQVTMEQYPLMVGTTNPTADRRFRVQLEGPVRAGLLTKANKLGLILSDCPYNARAFSRSAEPYIKSQGLTVAATATLSCESGSSDVGRVLPQIQNAVLQFRTRGVDTVWAEGIPVVIFAHEAESQGWRPKYLLTTGGAGIGPNVPAGQAQNMHGFGWLPAADVTVGKAPEPTPPQRRCLDMLKAEGIVPSQYNDFINVYTTCDALFLYEAALRSTAGSTDSSSVVQAITSLGTSYQSATTLQAATQFTSRRRDAPSQYRRWGWDAGCSCFVYSGQTAAMP